MVLTLPRPRDHTATRPRSGLLLLLIAADPGFLRFVVGEAGTARQMFSARKREIKMRSPEHRRKIEARAAAAAAAAAGRDGDGGTEGRRRVTAGLCFM